MQRMHAGTSIPSTEGEKNGQCSNDLGVELLNPTEARGQSEICPEARKGLGGQKEIALHYARHRFFFFLHCALVRVLGHITIIFIFCSF